MMPTSFKRGLIVGKFSPLHRGHMHVIQAAIDCCAEVVVISYSKPEFQGCETAARAGWLAALFPAVRSLVVDDAALARRCAALGIAPKVIPPNEAPDAIHREFTAWLCWTICGVAVDAVFTSEDYGDGFALALSAYFSARSGQPVSVTHVCVDRARLAVPVSGTAIRACPYTQRAFIDPIVYASFITRVRILGGESSGKTTLARALAQRLHTVWVPEVGRERWVEKGGHLRFDDMREIAAGQVARETALTPQARQWLVCDGSALTTAFYSADGYGSVDPVVQALARRSYGVPFVCAPDIAFEQDGTRRDASFRQRQHDWYLGVLAETDVQYTILSGSVTERVDAACQVLDAYPSRSAGAAVPPGKRQSRR